MRKVILWNNIVKSCYEIPKLIMYTAKAIPSSFSIELVLDQDENQFFKAIDGHFYKLYNNLKVILVNES